MSEDQFEFECAYKNCDRSFKSKAAVAIHQSRKHKNEEPPKVEKEETTMSEDEIQDAPETEDVENEDGDSTVEVDSADDAEAGAADDDSEQGDDAVLDLGDPVPEGFEEATNQTGEPESLMADSGTLLPEAIVVSAKVAVPPPTLEFEDDEHGGVLGHVYHGGTRYPAVVYPNDAVLRTRHPSGKGGWVHTYSEWQPNLA